MSVMTTATIEVLTAEVHVLMVGSRQVTLSVFRQLDWVDPDECEPMGRVNDSRSNSDNTWTIGLMIGRHATHGMLVRSAFTYQPFDAWSRRELERLREFGGRGLLEHELKTLAQMEKAIVMNQRWEAAKPVYDALPLIVLAGLK